jgi:hypothetical protein
MILKSFLSIVTFSRQLTLAETFHDNFCEKDVKGGGTRSPVLHAYYSFRQKCSILDTVVDKGLQNQKREYKFLFWV